MTCTNCGHECHCSNGSQCPCCPCMDCEHNALDEFWKQLSEKE